MIEDLPESKRIIKSSTGGVVSMFALIAILMAFPVIMLVSGYSSAWLGTVLGFANSMTAFVSILSTTLLIGGIVGLIFLYVKYMGKKEMHFYNNKIFYMSSKEDLQRELRYSDIIAAKVQRKETVFIDREKRRYEFGSDLLYSRLIDREILQKFVESPGPRSVYSKSTSLRYSKDLSEEFTDNLTRVEKFTGIKIEKDGNQKYSINGAGRKLGTIFSRRDVKFDGFSTLDYHVAIGNSEEPDYSMVGLHLDGGYECLITELDRGIDVGIVRSGLSINPLLKKEMGNNFLERKDSIGFNIMNMVGGIYAKRDVKRKHLGKIDLGSGRISMYEGTNRSEEFKFDFSDGKYNERFIILLVSSVFLLHRITRRRTSGD